MNEPWHLILREINSFCQYEKSSVMSKSDVIQLGHLSCVQLFRFHSQTLENKEEGLPGAKSDNNENPTQRSATNSTDSPMSSWEARLGYRHCGWNMELMPYLFTLMPDLPKCLWSFWIRWKISAGWTYRGDLVGLEAIQQLVVLQFS